MSKFKSKFFIILLSISFLLIINSCGTVFCTQNEVPALTITSNVPDAEVYLNGKYVGTTPYNHFGDKCDVKKITVRKEGFKDQSINPRKLSKWAYANFIPYPLANCIWGYFLDRSKSKCWTYKSDTFDFQLERR